MAAARWLRGLVPCLSAAAADDRGFGPALRQRAAAELAAAAWVSRRTHEAGDTQARPHGAQPGQTHARTRTATGTKRAQPHPLHYAC